MFTRASLKQAPPPRSVSVSGTSAVPVQPLPCAARQRPFGSATVPGRTVGDTVALAVHLAQLVEDAHGVAVLEAARGRVVRVHRQLDVGARQLAERRADRALARRRDQRERDSASVAGSGW